MSTSNDLADAARKAREQYGLNLMYAAYGLTKDHTCGDCGYCCAYVSRYKSHLLHSPWRDEWKACGLWLKR